MSNLVKWIEDYAEGEQIEGVVIGSMGWGDFGSEQVPSYDSIPRGKLLTWDQAKQWLDYDFSSGYGAPGCNAVYVWTETQVLFVVQYDGSTSMESVPRNPIATMPYMPGG